MLNKSFGEIYFRFSVFNTKTANKQVLKFAFLGFEKCVEDRSISHYYQQIMSVARLTFAASRSMVA